jgi:hypothetical protein
MKKLLILMLVVCLTINLIGCQSAMTNAQKDKIITETFAKGDIEATKQKIAELYKDDQEEAVSWLIAVDNLEDGKYKNKLEIQKGWTWDLDGDYTYVKGRVKNTGDKNITYFEVTAEYLDSAGNVLDSDYTNSGETIRPNNMKEFEIMHRHDEQYDEVQIFVNEVSVE